MPIQSVTLKILFMGKKGSLFLYSKEFIASVSEILEV